MKPSLYVIGASMGGVAAFQKIFKALGPAFKTPIVAVMHVPHAATIQYELIFGMFPGKVIEVADKTPIEAGHVYFAPPDYHVLIERDGTLALSQDEEVCFARPSIDVLFESAAIARGAEVCGILMTGANADGAKGLQRIHEAGGGTWVQDPRTAQATAMPDAALKLFKPDHVLSVEGISEKLMQEEDAL